MMISAENSSNNSKNKFVKKLLSMAISWVKVRGWYRDLSSQADPARENSTWSYPYFSQNRHFMLVENATHALSIPTRFDINFFENAWRFNCRVT